MIAELFPFLTNIERDLEGLSTRESNPLWCIGKTARNARINATITNFDRQLNAASTDDLTAYAEGLKPHLQRAMAYRAGDIWTDYQSTIADCHKHFCFAFFALILRAYDNKNLFVNARDYAASAGIEDFAALSSEVRQAANDWGIFHTPTIAELLAEKRQGRSQGQPQPRPKDAILNNPTAVSLLKMMQDAGLLDAAYQWRDTDNEGNPQRHTGYEKALFACYIDNKAVIPRWDKAFSD